MENSYSWKCNNTPYTTDIPRSKYLIIFVNNMYLGNIRTVWGHGDLI